MLESRPFKAITLVIASVGCISLATCSTIVEGTSQSVAISAPNIKHATCSLSGGDKISLTVTLPSTVHIPKSRNNIEVVCNAPGQAPVSKVLKSSYSNLSIVESPLGYPIDAISGAMWDYPRKLIIRFGGQEPVALTDKAGTRTGQ
jgi:hypothetical protein